VQEEILFSPFFMSFPILMSFKYVVKAKKVEKYRLLSITGSNKLEVMDIVIHCLVGDYYIQNIFLVMEFRKI